MFLSQQKDINVFQFDKLIIFSQEYQQGQMFRQSQQISQVHKALGCSSPTDNSKQLSKSSISSKSQTTDINLHTQIVQLKQKAHQSFMQVIQMQQLHQEELQVLRSQFIQKENQYQTKIADLELKNKQMQDLELKVKQLQYENITLQKNYKHHICDFQQHDLSIDNIELITYQEESRLDESSIMNFQEIININKHEEQFNNLSQQIQQQLKQLSNFQQNKFNRLVQQLLQYIQFIKKEFIKFQQKNSDKQRELNQSVQNNKFYENLQKESKFMSEHIKRLSAQKMKVQKKLIQAERQHKLLQDKLKLIQNNLSKRGIKIDDIVPRHRSPKELMQHQKSLDINQFIVQSFKKASNSNPISKTRYGLTIKNKI